MFLDRRHDGYVVKWFSASNAIKVLLEIRSDAFDSDNDARIGQSEFEGDTLRESRVNRK